jgi:integrase
VKVYVRGTTWWADFQYSDADGRQRRWRKSLKIAKTNSKRRALHAASDIKSALHTAAFLEDHGVALPGGHRTKVPCAFSGLAKAWLDDKRIEAEKRSTIERYATCIRLYLVNGRCGIGHQNVADITVDTVKALRKNLAARLAPSTVNQALHILRAILNHGVTAGYLTQNVALQVKTVRRTQATADSHGEKWDWYNAEEARTFLYKAYEITNYGPLFLTALHTGLRPGELLALPWEDVTLEGPEIGVQVNHTVSKVGNEWVVVAPKTKRSRRFVPIVNVTAEALTHHQHTLSVRVFCRPDGRPLTHQMVRNAMGKVARAATLRTVRFHDLRHTYASHLVAAGIPLLRVQKPPGPQLGAEHRALRTPGAVIPA